MKRCKLSHVFEPRSDGDHHAGSSRRSRRFSPFGISVGSVIASFGMIALSGSAHGQAVDLGTADNFAIITFTGVTNSGYSNVYGDIALYGTPTITGFINAIPSSGVGYVHGDVYYNNGVAGTAWTDADAAYSDLTLRGGATDLSGQDLGTLLMPLTAGVYNFTSSAQLTGNLVLDTGSDANAQFIFQIDSTLTTAVGSSITLIGAGAGNTQNIFWQVGSSATLNTGSQFVGNIFARTSISLQEGSNVSLGRLFALDGALTMLTNSTSPEGIVLAGPGSYWNGRESNIWTGENWSDTVAGDTPDGNLAINADVIFSINDNPQEQDTVLGADISISSLTVNDVIPVTIGGPNTLTITGTGGFTGITINSGAGVTTIDSNLELGVLAQTITVNNADGLVINGVMSGANGLIKQGTEELTLTGANTYTGATAINVGSLQVNSNNALGSNAAGTTVADGATLVLNNVAYSTTEALEINGAGVMGGGALTNTGTSSYAGQITAATNATINAGGGVLTLTGGLVKDGTTLTLTGGGTINIDTFGISGVSANSDLIVDSVTVNLNVANTYNGPTFIRSTAGAGLGILNANVVGALPTPRTELTMDDSGMGGSQLNLGAAQSVASLTGAASSLINLNANTLTVGTTAGSTTFAGVISGTGGLTKDGASTQILTGSNAYTGATNVMDGTLQLGDGFATGSIALTSAITVDALGTLALNLADLDTFDNSVINNGTIQWIASGTNTQGATSVFSGLGDMLITGTGTTVLLGDNSLMTGGTTVDTTGFVNVGNSSAFGPGTLTINNGTIDTVNSEPLQINVGDYVQTGGELRIRLSGPGGAVNTQYSVTGTADINGGTVFLYDGIDIYDLDGYTPSEGDIQMIVDSTLGLTGTGFARATLCL